jgi:hypothetical protein
MSSVNSMFSKQTHAPHSKTTRTFSSSMGLAVAMVGLPVGDALAQNYEGLSRETYQGRPQVAQSKADEYKPLGLRAGSFIFSPLIEAGLTRDSNIFRLPSSAEEAATIAYAAASAGMDSDWSRHAFNMYAWTEWADYHDFGNQNYKDYKITADGRVDVVTRSFATGKIGYMDLHEDRASLSNRGGIEPNRYAYAFAGVGYEHQPNRFLTRINLDYESLDFENNVSIIGTEIDNAARDRTRPEATLRLGYEVMPERTVFLQGAVNSVNYVEKEDAEGQERSSNGYKITSGMSFDLTALIEGDAYLGYVSQDYDDPAFDDNSGGLVGFGLTWYPTTLTTVYFDLDRNPQETTEPASSGYLSTVFSTRVDHELLANLLLLGSLRYVDNKYEQQTPESKEKENIFGIDLGIKYLINRRYYAQAAYTYERRDSDIDIQEYALNRFTVSVGANW